MIWQKTNSLVIVYFLYLKTLPLCKPENKAFTEMFLKTGKMLD